MYTLQLKGVYFMNGKKFVIIITILISILGIVAHSQDLVEWGLSLSIGMCIIEFIIDPILKHKK
jgi:hypothetical protein